MIGADGIEVIATSLSAGRKTVASADLWRSLIDRPVTAWPYGRVVVVPTPHELEYSPRTSRAVPLEGSPATCTDSKVPSAVSRDEVT